MKSILDILGAKAATIVLLVAIALACAVGTFFRLEDAFRLVYHAPWFFFLLGALAVNTLACTASELLKKTVPLSFLLLHLGTLVILAGGSWGYLAGEKGHVSLGVGRETSTFDGQWDGEDEMVLADKKTFHGELRGVREGRVIFFPRGGKPLVVPLEAVRNVGVDPERPGRAFEKDLVHGGDGTRLEGFVEAIGPETVRVRVEEDVKEFPRDQLVFLRMGAPDLRPLGFTLRLEDFRIERYEDTVKQLVVFERPDGTRLKADADQEGLLDLGKGFRARILRVLPDAWVDDEGRLHNRSDQPENPAVEVEIAWKGGKETRVAFSRFPEFHGSKKKSGVKVFFMSGGGMPKAYISEVEILEEGVPVQSGRIEVNDPLRYGGYLFYQSDYEMGSGPPRSVFQVVKDPACEVAYAGFILLMLGAVGAFYVRPLRAARRRAASRRSETGTAGQEDGKTAASEDENDFPPIGKGGAEDGTGMTGKEEI